MANNTVKLAVEEATKKTTAGDGRIVRIIGPVVDVKFDGAVPPIYNALTVEAETPSLRATSDRESRALILSSMKILFSKVSCLFFPLGMPHHLPAHARVGRR